MRLSDGLPMDDVEIVMRPPVPARKAIRRVSEKRLKANGGKMWSTISSAPKKRIRKKPRSKSEFARIYGSKQRVAFVKSLRCVACLIKGHSENAHIEGDGVGRKAGFEKIVPLCGARFPYEGCHGWLHRHGRSSLETTFYINLEELAAYTQKLWQSHTSRDPE